jgi:hypothetical protein
MLDLQLFYLDGWSDDIITKSQRRAATNLSMSYLPKGLSYLSISRQNLRASGGSGEEIKKHIIIIFVSFKSF